MASYANNTTALANPIDDLVRRKLRVGDPTDPSQVAQALLALYPVDRAMLERESLGMPFATTPFQDVSTSAMAAVNPRESDFIQAKADLDQDLSILVSEPALRNVAPGLRGWAQSVRSAVTEGMVAARFALDPGQRDKVFGIRRTLGCYARLARYVGVLTIESNCKYRRLARSIDQVSSLIFVQMGEAIAQQAMSGFLLQVSLSEIQSRSAGVINALRNLLGSLEASYDDNTWGRGRIGYRDLYDQIETRNQPDLKVLLQEGELARMMNELIELASSNSSDGLSALGATSGVIIDKMQRLHVIASSVPLQPPLVAFREALFLFIQGFVNNRMGLRAVDIGRPSITFYGSRFGMGSNDSDARARLVRLTFERGRLADALDDYLQDDWSTDRLQGQILLDKALYDIDRAIDLYVQGTDNWGPAEMRAAAYAQIIAGLVGLDINDLYTATPWAAAAYPFIDRQDMQESMAMILQQLVPVTQLPLNLGNVLAEEIITQNQAEARWQELLQSVAPSAFP